MQLKLLVNLLYAIFLLNINVLYGQNYRTTCLVADCQVCPRPLVKRPTLSPPVVEYHPYHIPGKFFSVNIRGKIKSNRMMEKIDNAEVRLKVIDPLGFIVYNERMTSSTSGKYKFDIESLPVNSLCEIYVRDINNKHYSRREDFFIKDYYFNSGEGTLRLNLKLEEI